MPEPIVLMVAEKPSICNAIAVALSGGNHSTLSGTPPVHSFGGVFQGQKCHYKVRCGVLLRRAPVFVFTASRAQHDTDTCLIVPTLTQGDLGDWSRL